MKYISSLDLLRGLAALFVCIYHFAYGNSDFLPNDSIIRSVASKGHLGVQIFFVISGFVIPYSMYVGDFKLNKWKQFFIKRITRIEPPYLLSIALVILLNFISTLSPYYRGSGFEFDWGNLLLHFGYLNAFFQEPWINPVYWTLAIEFQYYILICFIFPILVYPQKWLPLLLIAIISLITYIIPDNEFIFTHFLFFGLGILAFQFFINRLNLKEFLFLYSVILFIIYIKHDIFYMISGIIPVVFFLKTNMAGKMVSFAGLISYSLYLTHVPVGQRILNISENFSNDYSYRVLVLIAGIGISIFFAYIYSIIIENPFKKISKQIKYK